MHRFAPAILALCLCLPGPVVAQQQEITEQEIEFADHSWKLQARGTSDTKTMLGRDALFLERAQITLLDEPFSEGVIEFSLAAEQPSGFVGVNFRGDNQGNSEQFYVRFHQSERPDATQYLAAMNGLASWQLHAGPNDAAAVALGTGAWIPIRIVVEGDQADIFVRDMQQPLLHINELRTDNDTGAVTFYASDRPGMVTGAWFSNLEVRPLNEGEGVIGEAREEPAVPDSVFREWQLSSPLVESRLAGDFSLASLSLDELQWRAAPVESNGILNIARYQQRSAEADTVLLRLKVHADTATTRLFRFGYSDRVRIYVNGQQQFFGNAQWRSRDHRFLGTVGLHDAVPLHLHAGDNEVVAAVSESFGGWGFIGQIEDRQGLAFP